MNPSAPHRTRSPLAVVNALGLTVATLVTGAWDAGCHDHEAASSYAWCALDHEAETTGATNHASFAKAAAAREHSCVACRIGSSKSAEIGRSSTARPLDLASAAASAEDDGGARRGAPRRQAARGPPQG